MNLTRALLRQISALLLLAAVGATAHAAPAPATYSADEIVVGVLAVPPDAAQGVADRLVEADVRVIFNYSEQLLDVPPEVTVHTSSPAVDLLYALYFYLA